MNEQFVSSFEEACARLGKSTQLPDVSTFPDHLQKHVTATFKLSTILEVNNGEWKPDIADTTQRKYFPYFLIRPDENCASGFGLSFYDYGCDYSGTSLGVRLACKDAGLAIFMGENCTDLYKDLLA